MVRPEGEQERIMTQQQPYDKEEVARRGTEVYQRLVKPQLRPEDKGRLVAIDINTGAFEVADTMLDACRHLRERYPDAQIWGVRAGYVAVHGFGRIPEEP
jgi:hypothetical protein